MTMTVRPMLVTGEYVSYVIRQVAERGDVLGVLDLVKEGGMDLADLRRIVAGTHVLTGDNVEGYTMEPTGHKESSPYDVLRRQQERDRKDHAQVVRGYTVDSIVAWMKRRDSETAYAVNLGDLAQDADDWEWYDGSKLEAYDTGADMDQWEDDHD